MTNPSCYLNLSDTFEHSVQRKNIYSYKKNQFVCIAKYNFYILAKINKESRHCKSYLYQKNINC